ncbi:Digeranylgeranylglycerophospholipid reductase [Candidatus Gugararchaeum adminiculabundum]|nr:Digeranylgeranylglycerophospholipid reductase [Candidatus Gugararchaeum adminiculabundum]
MYDVVIIGSGPAGASAGLHAAKAGLKTAILEEHKTIGEPVHCGECLSEIGAQRLGLELPQKVISERVKGVKVIFPSGGTNVLGENGYVLEKHLFEQFIADEAQKNGCEIKLENRVSGIVRNANGDANAKTWKVKTNAGEYEAKIVIDASGPASVASRFLELNPKIKTVTGLQYLIEGIPREGYLDFYIWPRLAPHGYLWMIPKSGGRANVGLVTNEMSKAKGFLDEFVKQKGWQAKRIAKTFGGPIPESGPMARTYDDGLLLVGDAAGFTSPLFEGGTSLSLMSGRMAAETAGEAIGKGDISKRALSGYEMKWKKEFPAYSKLIRGKEALYRLSDSELDYVSSILPQTFSRGGMGNREKLKIGLKLIARPSLLTKGALTALFAFKYSQAEFYGW